MTRPLAPLALALVLTLAHVRSQPERCFSRQHRNATVNARAALAGAGVAAASRSVPTEQECVLACCSQRVPPGAKCNVAVFNGNKRKGGEDNCFLYHCPNERDCPLTKAPPGTRTYDIFKGAVHPSTARPVATTTIPGQPVAAMTAAPKPSAGTPVLPTATSTATLARAHEMPTKQSETKSHEKTTGEEAGPRTAGKLPKSTAPPTTTPAIGTPPPTTLTPPTTTVTPPAMTTTPPSATSSPPLPPPTPPTPPSAATPPTATATTPPPQTAIPPAPPTTTKASARPPPTATTPPSLRLTTPTPLTFGSRGSQTSEVPAGAQKPRVPVSAGPGALKSGVVALLVAAAAAMMLALALGGRKAMESFDRRHYTRLELNDLHYDL